MLEGMAGYVICPGFGQRGTEGKLIATQYCREHDLPTSVSAWVCNDGDRIARNVLGYKDANSTELNSKTTHNVIDIMEEQKNITNMGGTMRLGGYECDLRKGSHAHDIYQSDTIRERHRHRYEFNSDYIKEFEKAGMQCVGTNPESGLIEIVEIPGKKWFIGTQFHPEYSSTVLHPHPLFLDFVKPRFLHKANK